MKIRIPNNIFIAFTLILLISLLTNSSINAQQIKTNERDSIIVAVKEIIQAAKFCALITLNDKGLPNARTMDPFPVENNFVIWFGTNKLSRKVKEIKDNPNVTIYYAEPNGNGYVSITGKAEIIDDKNEKENRWKKEWEEFYPNRKETYILIKVTPVEVNVLSYNHKLIGNKKTWRIPHIKF